MNTKRTSTIGLLKQNGRKLNLNASSKLDSEKTRSYLSQTDVPNFSIAKALRVATAIGDNYGKDPTKPLRVAEAMEMTPTSGGFRALCGASIAYGLTEGGYNADVITLTPLAKRILSPTNEGDDLMAKKEATLRPRIIREFLTKYNNSRLPAEQIALNVLEEMGVPRDKAKQTLDLILECAREVGFVREMKGNSYIDLEGIAAQPLTDDPNQQLLLEQEEKKNGNSSPAGEKPSEIIPAPDSQAKPTNSRVFITHGKNTEIVGQIKELLAYGKFQPVVSVEQETVSKPVSDKVMDDMRSCAAAIVHVGTELKLLDSEGKEQRFLNQNVLIEIGACLALYGRRFILLVERGVTLPSNLQGLYEVRYEGMKLDYEATMKLLKAFNDFKI
jgi:predicted nucleotide-binding protein